MSFPTILFNTVSGTDANAPATSGTAVSGTSTYYSAMFSGMNRSSFSGQVMWTGTPTGTLTLWYSDKPNPSIADDSDWTQDTAATFTNPAGAAGSTGFQGQTSGSANGYRHRIKYVNASGTGVLTGFAHAPRNA